MRAKLGKQIGEKKAVKLNSDRGSKTISTTQKAKDFQIKTGSY